MTGPACGLRTTRHIDIEVIIAVLTKDLQLSPRKRSDGEDLAAMVEDLARGHGPSRGKGGRPRKDRAENPVRTNGVNGTPPRTTSRSSATRAARMAESRDPHVRAAWKGYLTGSYKSVTAGAGRRGPWPPR